MRAEIDGDAECRILGICQWAVPPTMPFLADQKRSPCILRSKTSQIVELGVHVAASEAIGHYFAATNVWKNTNAPNPNRKETMQDAFS